MGFRNTDAARHDRALSHLDNREWPCRKSGGCILGDATLEHYIRLKYGSPGPPLLVSQLRHSPIPPAGNGEDIFNIRRGSILAYYQGVFCSDILLDAHRLWLYGIGHLTLLWDCSTGTISRFI